MKRLRTRDLMIAVAFLGVAFAQPIRWLTPKGELFRRRADVYARLAAEWRIEELKARKRGDIPKAERIGRQVGDYERQGWVFRKASWHEWRWPELGLRGSLPLRVP